VEVQLHAFLTSALDGDELTALHPKCFTPQGKSPQYPLDRRLDGLQNQCSCGGEEKEDPCPCQELNPSHPACSLVTILTELSWITWKLTIIVLLTQHQDVRQFT
jgi:hypothetical protein